MTQIPAWTAEGLVPPIRPGAPGHSLDRSPYVATSLDVVERFATNSERCGILNGWLQYRQALYESGVVSGFQWLDGSFLENLESDTPPRSPGDVDVVTFFALPEGLSQVEYSVRFPDLFEPGAMKAAYGVDAYGIVLGQAMNKRRVNQVSYWYSLWSHRREDFHWKGFIQVDLELDGDDDARARLSQSSQELAR